MLKVTRTYLVKRVEQYTIDAPEWFKSDDEDYGGEKPWSFADFVSCEHDPDHEDYEPVDEDELELVVTVVS